MVILLGAEPEFSESQLTRALIAAEAEKIRPIIVLNKRDLTPLFDRSWQRLEPYRTMGYTVLATAFKPRQSADGTSTEAEPTDNEALAQALQGKTSLILGPSGAGKSTLINRWVPQAQVLTQEISSALNSGKHTTTSTTLYWMDAAKTTALIDSPGFQEFGLHHIAPMQLAQLMPDIGAVFLMRLSTPAPSRPSAPRVSRFTAICLRSYRRPAIDAALAQKARQREQRQDHHPHHHRTPY